MTNIHTKPSVLVIDDEPAVAKLHAHWLSDDYTVDTAYSGAEALERLGPSVSVVLLDRLMPGLHGDEVLEEIRRHGYDCRVAMVTAIEPDFDVVEMGFDDYLTKPVTEGKLRETVRRLLRLATYDELGQEYWRICRKKALLEEQKSSDELAASPEYRRLKRSMLTTRQELDATLQTIDETGYRAILRDLTPTESNPSPPQQAIQAAHD